MTEHDDEVDEVEQLARRALLGRDRVLRDAAELDASAAEARFICGARARLRLRTRGPRRLGVAIAAAVLLATTVAWLMQGSGMRPPRASPIELGIGLIEPIAPSGANASFEVFSWRITRAVSPRYLLVVRSDDGREVLRVRDLSEPRYRPTPDEVARLPERIRWQIAVQDATGETIDAASAQASR